MGNDFKPGRRDFLKTSVFAVASAGGGLMLGVGVSGEADAAATTFAPNIFIRISPDNWVRMAREVCERSANAAA